MRTILYLSLIIIATSAYLKGIDVSTWQGKNIDWKKVKSDGVKFAIIRAGYVGKGGTVRDNTFDINYKNAKAAKVPLGVYWYSYATSQKGGEKEALACMSVIKGKKFEWPIYIDIEENSQLAAGKKAVSSVVRGWCETLKKHKYYCGLYCGASDYGTHFEDDVKKKYPIWVAHWYVKKPSINGKWGVWQYSEKGNVKGIQGNVDLDYGQIDYEPIIKKGHYNGY